jgi:Tfp pilus assembly protein PilF
LALAEELLKEVVKKNPHHLDARIDLARAYVRQKKIKKGLAQFAFVLSQEKRFARYHLELGSVMMSGGALPAARREFERALVLSPGNPDAKKLMAALEKKEAERSSEKDALKAKPESSSKK